MANLLNVSTFLCMDRLFYYFHLLTFVSSVILALQVCVLILGFLCMDRLFYYFHLLTFVSSVILALQVCVLILGYAVRIIHITPAKCIMFGVSWCKSLKGSMTPASLYSKFCFSCLFVCVNFRANKGALAQIVQQVFLQCITLLHTEHSAFPVCLNTFQGYRFLAHITDYLCPSSTKQLSISSRDRNSNWGVSLVDFSSSFCCWFFFLLLHSYTLYTLGYHLVIFCFRNGING